MISSAVRRAFGCATMDWLLRASYRVQRLRRAWKYFRGCLDDSDAQRIMLDCRVPAGWHPLITLTVEDTLEEAQHIRRPSGPAAVDWRRLCPR